MEEQVRIEKIMSGGQTGADRAALEFAIKQGIPHHGWCPRGRKAEDGLIPSRFKLKETPSAGYSQRTEWNARDSDGTVVFTVTDQLEGGSKKTILCARRFGKPWLHLAAKRPGADHAGLLRRFVERNQIKVLNVAGPRGSEAPAISKFVTSTLRSAFAGALPAKRILRALIVDDEPCLRNLYGAILQGFQVDDAETSEQALRVARRRRLDLVVTDFNRPGRLNGLQFIAAVKKLHPSASVIMASGSASLSVQRRAIRLGACACLTKPFLVETLLAAVDDGLFHPRSKAARRH